MESCPALIIVKVPQALADEIRRRANRDDRSVSAYVRRVLARHTAQAQQ